MGIRNRLLIIDRAESRGDLARHLRTIGSQAFQFSRQDVGVFFGRIFRGGFGGRGNNGRLPFRAYLPAFFGGTPRSRKHGARPQHRGDDQRRFVSSASFHIFFFSSFF